MDETAVIRSWSAEPFTLLTLAIAAVVYFRGWRSLHHQAPHRFSPARLYSFLASLVTLYVAIASPLDAFAGFLLQVHMIQHLLLTMVVPPLILLGTPWLPLLRGLPRVWVREVIGPLINGRFGKALAGFFGHPVIGWLLFVASNVLWHLPPFYEATLRSDSWHEFEHACFLFTGLLFWWHVILPWPARPRWSPWAAIPYLLLADLQNTALAAFLTFYDRPLYPAYVAAPRLWGTDVLSDQAAAGVIMWVPGSLAFLIPAGIIAARLLSPQHAVRPSGTLTVQSARGSFKARNSLFLRFARTPLRRVLQMALLLLAIVVVADGFFGPRVASANMAGVLPWTYWRGLSVVALLTVGNIFCMSCPFVLARDAARRLVPGRRALHWPRSLRNKWMALALFASFLWAYEVFDLWAHPAWTAALILGYFAMAIAIDVVFRGASFCKYVCPIGQYHYAFAENASAEIRIREPATCASCRTHDCLRGNEHDRGCELHLFQPRKAGNVDCTFCLDCVRACPAGNVDLLPVVPARDLASNRFRSAVGRYGNRPDLAALFALFAFGALVNAAGMTTPVKAAIASTVTHYGLPEPVVTTAFFLYGLLVLPLAAGFVTALCSGALAGEAARPMRLMITFARAFVPLGAAIWASHFLFHLATGAFTIVPVTERFLGLTPDWSRIGFSGDWIVGLELTLLDLGLLASLYLSWRIARERFPTGRRIAGFVPWGVLATLLFAAAVWMIFQPMDMRGTMLSGH